MSDDERKPRRHIWEVQPINARVDEEIDKAVKTPEDTDINAHLKRIKLDRVRKMVDEAQTLEVEEAIEERRLSLEEMRAKRKDLVEQRRKSQGEERLQDVEQVVQPPKMSGDELSKLVEVSKLPPEQREEFYRAVAYTRGMYGGSGANSESMIPLLLAFSRQNKEIGFPEMIEFSKNLMSVAKQMREESREQGGNVDINEIVKTIYAEKGKEPDSFTKFLAQIEQVEKIRNLISPPQSASSANTSVEMAKVERGHELELKKLEQQKILEEQKIDLEKKKTEAFGANLTRIAATAGAAFAAGEAEGGEVEHRARKRPDNRPENLMEFACTECGSPIVVPNPKPGDQATCGKCGWMHTISKEEKGGESKQDGQGK